MNGEIDQLLNALKLLRRFQFDSRSSQIQAPVKSFDAQIHSETDVQYEILGRKTTRRKRLAQNSQKAAD
jgi:hypothetical protein